MLSEIIFDKSLFCRPCCLPIIINLSTIGPRNCPIAQEGSNILSPKLISAKSISLCIISTGVKKTPLPFLKSFVSLLSTCSNKKLKY